MKTRRSRNQSNDKVKIAPLDLNKIIKELSNTSDLDVPPPSFGNTFNPK